MKINVISYLEVVFFPCSNCNKMLLNEQLGIVICGVSGLTPLTPISDQLKRGFLLTISSEYNVKLTSDENQDKYQLWDY